MTLADLDAFLRPLYQDLDGGSRMEDAERVAAIARQIYRAPSTEEERQLDLLLRFRGIGGWLNKVGNLSRTLLTVRDVSERELRNIADSIRRLDDPQSEVERAVAAAVLIDGSGVRGLAERMARARREGLSVADVVREVLGDSSCPQWMPDRGRPLLLLRQEARRALCRQILEETALRDLPLAGASATSEATF